MHLWKAKSTIGTTTSKTFWTPRKTGHSSGTNLRDLLRRKVIWQDQSQISNLNGGLQVLVLFGLVPEPFDARDSKDSPLAEIQKVYTPFSFGLTRKWTTVPKAESKLIRDQMLAMYAQVAGEGG